MGLLILLVCLFMMIFVLASFWIFLHSSFSQSPIVKVIDSNYGAVHQVWAI